MDPTWQVEIRGLAMFDELVLHIPLVQRDALFHARFDCDEVGHIPSGMSLRTLCFSLTPGESTFSEHQK